MQKEYIFFILFLSAVVLYLLYGCTEKYSAQPIIDNNYIDIYNNEEIQLRRGSTASIAVPPTLKQSFYADKGLVVPNNSC